MTVGTILYGDYFGDSIRVLEKNAVMGELAREFHGPVAFALHGLATPTVLVGSRGCDQRMALFPEASGTC